MNCKLSLIKDQIHSMIEDTLILDMNKQLPEIFSNHIALQSYVTSLTLTDEEEHDYLLDEEVKEYMNNYQNFCIDYELHLEQLMGNSIVTNECQDKTLRCLRAYYSNFYKILTKNEIYLSSINKNAKVCMVGIGSMPLSMMFINRFSQAHIDGIDKSSQTLYYTQQFIDYLTKKMPVRYSKNDLTIYFADGEKFNYNDYDAVIISIYIANKDRVITQILKSNAKRNKLVIIDRQCEGLSQYFYKNYPITDCHYKQKLKSKIKSGIITSQILEFEFYGSSL